MGDTSHPADESVVEFLGRKGAVELLCEVDPEGSQFARLVEELPVSRTTVSTRLQEGEEVGLLETGRMESRGASHAYTLTESGARVRVYLDQRGTTEKYRQLKRLRQEFERQTEELRAWVIAAETTRKPPGETSFRQLLREYTSAGNSNGDA